MPLNAGETFAGFRIVRLLGSGGMGEVYLAEHPRLPRRDALKVLPAEFSADTDYRERFVREADLAANLWHPHIVSVHDRGEHHGQLWISMNYVDGLDAARLLAARSPEGLPTDQVVRIVEAVAGALDYAHKQGLLHRDVKPANIMLSHADDEGERRVLLADFGIARSVGEISGLTATNMTVGTVAYSAPEQLLGEDLDGRADQYALAATAYHLLSGSQLFPHSNPAVVIGKHLNAEPPTLAASDPELSGLDPVLALALAKDPKDRFARCSDFARALAEQASMHNSSAPLAATRPAVALPKSTLHISDAQASTSASDRPVANDAQRRWLVSGAVLAAVLSLGGIAFGWHPWMKGGPARPSVTLAAPTAATDTSPSIGSPPLLTTTRPAAPKIVEVDPADYEADTPGYYHWAYAKAPVNRECSLFPGGVACDVVFPTGTPEVTNGEFSGPPNEVWIKPPDGPTNMIGESEGGATLKMLLPNHRITVGDFTCTALPGGGIDCEAPTGGFTFTDGVLTKRGKR
jgi:serine/threonine protein kinase, bacterial